MRRLSAFLAVLLLAGTASGARAEAPAPAAAAREVFLLLPPPLKPEAPLRLDLPLDHVGFILVDPSDGTVLAEHNADEAFIPASVAKVPTTLAALLTLGPGHRYETVLGAKGNVSGGALTGILYLKGGGDPLLSTDDIAPFCTALSDAGIRRVDGRFLVDATALSESAEIEATQPEDVAYNAGVSALSLNFNRVHVVWRPSGKGLSVRSVSQADKSVVPLDFIDLDLSGRRAVNGERFSYQPVEGGAKWSLAAGYARKGAAWLPVKQPPEHAGRVFKRLCARTGVVLPDPEPGEMPSDVRILARHLGQPLSEVARLVLKHSNNMAAELVGLTTTRALTGAAVTLGESGALVADWWRGVLPEVDWRGFRLANHSGLSADSRLSPRQAAAMLTFARAHAEDGFEYPALLKPMDWLVIPPEEYRAKRGKKAKPQPAGAVRAKTGTMYYARGLAGLVTTSAGRELVFAIFSTDHDKRIAFDADTSRRRPVSRNAPGWLSLARGVERQLLLDWATRY